MNRGDHVRSRPVQDLVAALIPLEVIQIEVETPTRLSTKQRELLEAFRETETGAESPKSDSFFGKLRGMWDDLTE